VPPWALKLGAVDAVLIDARERFITDFAYRALAAEARTAVAAHVDEIVALAATVIRAGVADGTFRKIDPIVASQAILIATSRFHHPAHVAEWRDPAVDAAYDGGWGLLMRGLCESPSTTIGKSHRPAPTRRL